MDGKELDYARAGDHIMTPFSCDLCVFRSAHHRDPEHSIETDQNTLASTPGNCTRARLEKEKIFRV